MSGDTFLIPLDKSFIEEFITSSGYGAPTFLNLNFAKFSIFWISIVYLFEYNTIHYPFLPALAVLPLLCI